MKKRILSMLLAAIMVLAIVPFSTITAFAADEMVIDIISFNVPSTVGATRLTADQITFNDEGNPDRVSQNARLEIKGNIKWTKDTQFGTEMGANEVYEINKTYYATFVVGIKDEYKANTSYSSSIMNRIYGQLEAGSVQAVFESETDIKVVLRVAATVPKIVINIPKPLVNDEMTFADLTATAIDPQGYYSITTTPYYESTDVLYASESLRKNSTDKITHGTYSTRIQLNAGTAKIIGSTPIEIQGVENYRIIRKSYGGTDGGFIDISINTNELLKSIDATVTTPAFEQTPGVPVAPTGTTITAYEWHEMEGGIYGKKLSTSDVFEVGKIYRLTTIFKISDEYSLKDGIVPTINGKDVVININNGTFINCYCDFEVLPPHTHAPTADDGDCTTPITCACGEVMTAGAASHTGGTATCAAKAKCDVCGKEYGETLAHTHGTEWKNDADNHWNECTCGDKANVAAHADSNSDEKCDACSYAMPKAEENDPSAPTPDLPDTNTEKPTDKPTDATESEKDDSTETEAPADKGCGGCGSSAALSVVALVGVIGTALVIKKKED